jgi:hypothetical protein
VLHDLQAHDDAHLDAMGQLQEGNLRAQEAQRGDVRFDLEEVS